MKNDEKAVKTTKTKPVLHEEVNQPKVIKVNKKVVTNLLIYVLSVCVIVLLIIGLDAGIQEYKRLNYVAKINGEYITKSEFQNGLNSIYANNFLTNTYYYSKLVEMEAEKNGYYIKEITDEQVNDYIKKEEPETDIEELIKYYEDQRGITKEWIYYAYRIQMLQDKLIGEIVVTDQEIDDYIKAETESGTPSEELTNREEISEQLKNNKINEKQTELMEKLESQASLENYLKDKPKYEFLKELKSLFKEIKDKIKN